VIRDFVAEAVEIVGPEQGRRAACAERVAWTLATLPRFGLETPQPSNGALRAEIKAFASSLRRARLKFDSLSPWSKAVLFTAGDETFPGAAVDPESFAAMSDRLSAMSDALVHQKGIPIAVRRSPRSWRNFPRPKAGRGLFSMILYRHSTICIAKLSRSV
jgi:hypothetical protein